MATQVVNIARKTWKQGERNAAFSSSRPAWGIMDTETGLFLAKDQKNEPSVWDRKWAAESIAPYAAEMPKHSFKIEVNG